VREAATSRDNAHAAKIKHGKTLFLGEINILNYSI
jgi:hypothetical protein